MGGLVRDRHLADFALFYEFIEHALLLLCLEALLFLCLLSPAGLLFKGLVGLVLLVDLLLLHVSLEEVDLLFLLFLVVDAVGAGEEVAVLDEDVAVPLE